MRSTPNNKRKYISNKQKLQTPFSQKVGCKNEFQLEFLFWFHFILVYIAVNAVDWKLNLGTNTWGGAFQILNSFKDWRPSLIMFSVIRQYVSIILFPSLSVTCLQKQNAPLAGILFFQMHTHPPPPPIFFVCPCNTWRVSQDKTSWSFLGLGVEVGLTPNCMKGIHIFPLLIVGSFFFLPYQVNWMCNAWS